MMESTPDLYDTLFQIFGQYRHWLDIRHLHTLIWMVVGLIESQTIKLPAWAPHVNSRAQYAQSTVRRFSRWLHNERVQASALWGPIIQSVLETWVQQTVYLALDTTVLWDRFCHIRISVVYRGRAIPLVWKTIEHGSSAVAMDALSSSRIALALPHPHQIQLLYLSFRASPHQSRAPVTQAWASLVVPSCSPHNAAVWPSVFSAGKALGNQRSLVHRQRSAD